MTTEEVIIAIVRVLGSLPVLLFPFPGALLAILTDLSDLFLKDLLHEGGVRDYQEFDKWLDQVYMAAFLIVALRWQPVPRNIAVALYAYRLAGFVTFEITQERDLLILFPNVFEFWFVFVAFLKQFHLEGESAVAANDIRPRSHDDEPDRRPALAGLLPFRYTTPQLAVTLAVLLFGKLVQEYILHVGQWLDDFTATEAVQWIWDTLTPPW